MHGSMIVPFISSKKCKMAALSPEYTISPGARRRRSILELPFKATPQEPSVFTPQCSAKSIKTETYP